MKKILALLLALLMILSLAACGQGGQEQAQATGSSDRKSVV